jgi:hypothetical protein
MSFSLFQISSAIRDDAQVCMGRHFIRFESECFLKRCACGSGVTAIESSHAVVNNLLRLLRSCRNAGHEKAQKAQNDFLSTTNHSVLFVIISVD